MLPLPYAGPGLAWPWGVQPPLEPFNSIFPVQPHSNCWSTLPYFSVRFLHPSLCPSARSILNSCQHFFPMKFFLPRHSPQSPAGFSSQGHNWIAIVSISWRSGPWRAITVQECFWPPIPVVSGGCAASTHSHPQSWGARMRARSFQGGQPLYCITYVTSFWLPV